MENPILYFGYGANREGKMMSAITGLKEEELMSNAKPAVLKGYRLAIQRLDQVPNIVSPNAPAPLSPQTILRNGWGEGFTSYTIVPDEKSEVQGTVWELDQQARDLVEDWELIPFGWYDRINDAETEMIDGTKIKVVTEGLGKNQEVDEERQIDGKKYNPWLNSPEDFVRNATRAREEYLERQTKTEGQPALVESR